MILHHTTKMATKWLLLVLQLFILLPLVSSLSLSVEPKLSSLDIGDTVEFTCKLRLPSEYECEEQGFLIWSKEGGILISNSTDVLPNFLNKYTVTLDFTRSFKYTKCQYSLVLHNITKSMGGTYGCVYYPRPQYTKYIPYEVIGTTDLMIKSKPAPQFPLCSASLLPNHDNGDLMRFRCESEEGHPAVSLYWWYDGIMLDGIRTQPRKNYIRVDFIIGRHMFERFANSELLCTMTNPANEEQQEVYNTCSLTTGMKVSVEQSYSVHPTESMKTFQCHIDSGIPYDLIWYYDGIEIDPLITDDRFLIETKAKALHIRSLSSFDHGAQITCEARSVFGSANASTVLESSGLATGPSGMGHGGYVNTGAIVGLICVGFIILFCINIAICLVTRTRTRKPRTKTYPTNNNLDEITPMDTDDESSDERDSVNMRNRPNSAVILAMPDMSESGIRYANVSRTMSIETDRVPSSIHYQSPSSLNESHDASAQPLALELSTSGSETSGSQECLKHGTYTARENSYADLRELQNYECPRPQPEREDSGVDVRQSYVSMDGQTDGVMEDTYEPIDTKQDKQDPEDPRPNPPSAPVPRKLVRQKGARATPLPQTPSRLDEYMDMKHGGENRNKDKSLRISMPDKLPNDQTLQSSIQNQVKRRSTTLASPMTTHKALIQKFENGPDKNDNHKKVPERNHNLNKDNFKGIKDKFKGSKENFPNGTETKKSMFKKRLLKQSSTESPKMKRKMKKEKAIDQYTDLDRSSMSSDSSGAYQQICLARSGRQIEDSGVYENIDS